MRKHGSWDAVYQSDDWPEVLATAIKVGLPETYRCGDWPVLGEKCGACGKINHG